MNDLKKTKGELAQEVSVLRRLVGELTRSLTEATSELETLKEREGRFATAFLKSAIPMAITTTGEGRYVEVNEAFADVMGMMREDMIGQTSTGIGYITPLQRAIFLREVDRRGLVENLELEVKTGTGETRHGLFNSTRVRIGSEDYFLTIVTDITGRRVAEEALKESEERFRTFHEATFGGICIHDEGTIVEASEGLALITGYSREELIGMNALAFIAPEYHDLVKKFVLAEHDKPYDVVGRRKDGSPCFFEVRAKTVPMGNRRVRIAEFRDVTERRRSEEAFRESERRYRELCESLPEIVAEFDDKGNFLFVNQNGFKTFGYTQEDFERGLNVVDMVAPEDRPRLAQAMKRILAGEQTAGSDYQMVKKDGTRITAVAYTNPIISHDRVAGFRTILVDITDRKSAEEALRRSETRYRTLLESINDGVYMLDESGRFTFVNEVIVERTGRSRDWFMGRSFLDLILPEYRKIAREGFAAEMKGTVVPPTEIGVMYSDPPSRELWVEVNTKPLYEGDRIVGVLGTSRDITVRRATEEALRKSEERFRRLAENARDMIFRISLPDRRYQYVSPSSFELTGYPPEDFYLDHRLGRRIVHHDWSAYFAEARRRLMSGEERVHCEYKILHRSGEERWLYQRDVLVRDKAGKPVAVEGMVTDISERKRAEEALRDSEEKYRSIFEKSPLGIFQTTLDGRFISVNPALARILRFDSPQEVVDSFSDIGAQIYVDPNQRSTFLRELLEDHERRTYETEYYRKDGKIWIGHLSLSVVRDEQGVPQHLDGIVEDVTEKKMMEKRLQETMEHLRTLSRRLLEIQETERRYIARELHDEIGQTLTALNISLKRTRLSGPGAAPAEDSLDESVKMVQGLLKQVRNLSIELRPSILDDFGLTAALDWYIKWVSSRAGLETEFHTDLREERLPPLIELTCFRITQEALTNAVRHSGAKKVRVHLQANDGELRLTVLDDGKGFDVDKTYGRALKGKTFGILGMEERASLAGGRLVFTSKPGKGTTVHARFPLQYLSRSS